MMFSTRILTVPIIAAAFILIGCASNNVAPLPQAPNLIYKTTVAGQALQVTQAAQVNPDCTTESTPIIKIIEPPQHGNAVVTQREAFPEFPANHPRVACNNTKTTLVVVDYTPYDGFTGMDQMVFETFGHTGYDSGQIKALITVK